MDNLLAVARQVAVLFVLMGLGAALRKARLLSDAALAGLVNILILVVTPCLIIDVFQRPFDPAMLKGLGCAFALAVLIHVILIFLARAVVRNRATDVRRPLLLAAVFSNAGFMGIPLQQAVLGDAGVFYGTVYVAVFNLFIWSWGVGVMKKEKSAGRDEGAVRRAGICHCSAAVFQSIVNPGTIGLAFGAPLFFLSVKLPTVIGAPIHHLANLNTPLAMLVIGHCLVGADFGKVIRTGAVYVAAFARLVVGPLLAITLLYPLRSLLDWNMMLATVIAASTPVAAMVSMFATKYRRDVDVSVAVVSGTTLVSIFTMPVMIAFAMGLLSH